MSYDDYLRTWTVLAPVEIGSKCQPKQEVTFHGESDAVTILCEKEQPYGEGRYDGPSDTIRRDGEYVISMVKAGTGPDERDRIAFGPDGSIAGSWTAEDQSPWPEP